MFGPNRNRLESLYPGAVSPPGMRTGNRMPPVGFSFNPYLTGFESISDSTFGTQNVQSYSLTDWSISASNVGVNDIRYKLKQIIFAWRNHTVVVQESAITSDDVDVVFFQMPVLNIFGDESPSTADKIYLYLCTGSGVTVVPPSVSGLYSSL
jgi:hypothetical protein